LPDVELTSGYAEVIKHALISDVGLWNDIQEISSLMAYSDWESTIRKSINVKTVIVEKDPKENGERKLLNFGHTIGHALEAHYFPTDKNINHGWAVAEGMIIECLISTQNNLMTDEVFQSISHFIRRHFNKIVIAEKDLEALLLLMIHDKKNEGDQINFTLLTDIGSALINQMSTPDEVKKALELYQTLQ